MQALGLSSHYKRKMQKSKSPKAIALDIRGITETKKKPCIFRHRAFQVLVRLAGIEPTTPWFVAKYSIQLSYSREAVEYSMGFSESTNTVQKSQKIPSSEQMSFVYEGWT